VVQDILRPEKDRVRASGLNDDPAGGVLDGAPDRLVIVWGRDARQPSEAAANLPSAAPTGHVILPPPQRGALPHVSLPLHESMATVLR
jgi:hypothetical protein